MDERIQKFFKPPDQTNCDRDSGDQRVVRRSSCEIVDIDGSKDMDSLRQDVQHAQNDRISEHQDYIKAHECDTSDVDNAGKSMLSRSKITKTSFAPNNAMTPDSNTSKTPTPSTPRSTAHATIGPFSTENHQPRASNEASTTEEARELIAVLQKRQHLSGQAGGKLIKRARFEEAESSRDERFRKANERADRIIALRQELHEKRRIKIEAERRRKEAEGRLAEMFAAIEEEEWLLREIKWEDAAIEENREMLVNAEARIPRADEAEVEHFESAQADKEHVIEEVRREAGDAEADCDTLSKAETTE